MFENLQERLGSILNGLTGRGALSEADVAAALRAQIGADALDQALATAPPGARAFWRIGD